MIVEKHSNRGITLIALVITIIVLLILAGITIAALIGNDGLLTKANQSSISTDIEETKELIKLELIGSINADKTMYTAEDVAEAAKKVTGNDLNGNIVLSANGNEVDLTELLNNAVETTESAESTESTTQADATEESITVGKAAQQQGTINGEEGTSMNPTIPLGYTPIDTDTSSWGDGSTAPSEESVNAGLVIKDNEGNEWVWVPVEDVSVMYETSNTEIELAGNTGVSTNMYSASEVISGQTRGVLNSMSYREPDLAVGDDGTSQDYLNYTAAGFSSLSEMAQTMVDEYENMIESIEAYGGFYIGRYELTEEGEKPGTTLTNTTWYELYKKCTDLAQDESNTKTSMIWGVQWDVTCLWLAENGYDIEDSSGWGNYSSSTGKAAVSGYGSKQNTGYSENWKANNIYDLAGNCSEFTQETYDGSDNIYSYRVGRGGYYNNNGNSYSVTYRNFTDTDSTYADALTSRATLLLPL